MGVNNCCSSRHDDLEANVIRAQIPENNNELNRMIKQDLDEKRKAQDAAGWPDKTIHSGFDAIVNEQFQDHTPVFETNSLNNT